MEVLDIEWPTGLLQAWFEAAVPRFVHTGVLLLAAVVLYLVAGWILRRFETNLTARTETEMDDIVLGLIRRAALMSILFWLLWRIIDVWTDADPITGTRHWLTTVVLGAWIIGLALPVSNFVSELLEIFQKTIAPKTKTDLDDTILPLANKFTRFLILALGVLMAMPVMGVSVTPLLGGAGIVGLAISFAAKDTLSNFIAGLLLIIDRPFQIGDRIELWNAPKNTGTWGDVIEIGLRAIKVKNPDNIIVIIPNNEVMRRDIINYTAAGQHIRLRIPIGIGYDADTELAKKLILEVAAGIDGILPTPPPVVITRSFDESSVGLEARVWIKEARQRRAIGDELTDRVKSAFDENGIEIPYPKRDLYIRTMPAGIEAPTPPPDVSRDPETL